MEKPIPDFSNMPTGKQVRAFLPKLESIIWEKYSPQLHESIDGYKAGIEKILREITGGFSLMFRPFNGSIQFPFNFYRIRPFDEIKNMHLRNEYSYPPPNIPSYQRANLPGYPALYASDSPITAIMEVIRSHKNLEKEKDFCLSVWKIKGEQSAVLAPLLYDGIPKENPFFEFGQYPKGKEPDEMKSWFTNEQIEGCEEMQKFFSRIFQNDESYGISAFIAHRHMYNEVDASLDDPNLQYRADIIIFPSIRMDKRSINYAIHPNFVDEKMTLKSIYKVKVQNIKIENGVLNEASVSFKEYAINDKSRIIWLKANPEDHFFETRLKEDFPNENAEFSFRHFKTY